MEYQIFTLPHGFEFKKLSRKHAKENFQSFVKRIPERMAMLQSAVCQDIPSWRPDWTENSLSTLGTWYCPRVVEREVTEAERTKMRLEMGEQYAFLSDMQFQFTTLTMSLALDIGIYIGEYVRARCPASKWLLGLGSKKSSRFQEPLLGGFVQRTELQYLGAVQYSAIANGTCVATAVAWNRRQYKYKDMPPPEAWTEEMLIATARAVPIADPKAVLVKIANKCLDKVLA